MQVTLWAFQGMKSLSLGPDDVRRFSFSFMSSARRAAVSNAAMQVILDKMYALSDMCVTQFVSKQAAFDTIRRGPSPALNPRAVPCASSLPPSAPHPAFPHCRASPSCSVLCEVSGVAVSHAIKIHN